jgi:hypothetical protein
VPRLVCLESSANSFPADLESLDRLSPRTFDTILAYYVRAGQANPQVIFNDFFLLFSAVLRIHDVLVWIQIRIRIRGSMPLTNGSGFGSFYFHH